MRAKRSKKYRKIMSAYQLSFSFREPYQVLLDAAFIRTCHAFHMPLQKYLENTLHGQCRIFVTRCTLAKIMAEHQKAGGHPKSRPEFLPPPTELPLRHCKHKNKEGDDMGELSEAHCLLDLLAGQPRGNETAKNKQHYILATADPPEPEQKKKGFVNVRERARMIPGVPIIYVKRSVMILEELSGASEHVRRGQERDKFKEGLVGTRKRKRGEDEGDEQNEDPLLRVGEPTAPKTRDRKKVKGPNPLSVLKKKAKVPGQEERATSQATASKSPPKPKRRGKRGGNKTDASDFPAGSGADLDLPNSRLEEAVSEHSTE